MPKKNPIVERIRKLRMLHKTNEKRPDFYGLGLFHGSGKELSQMRIAAAQKRLAAANIKPKVTARLLAKIARETKKMGWHEKELNELVQAKQKYIDNRLYPEKLAKQTSQRIKKIHEKMMLAENTIKKTQAHIDRIRAKKDKRYDRKIFALEAKKYRKKMFSLMRRQALYRLAGKGKERYKSFELEILEQEKAYRMYLKMAKIREKFDIFEAREKKFDRMNGKQKISHLQNEINYLKQSIRLTSENPWLVAEKIGGKAGHFTDMQLDILNEKMELLKKLQNAVSEKPK
ncbi:MAG: hypothetical protein NTZ73_04225 [Candidatus Diapherotrites archaeon]|nr:hypothetical protein [Candidatus Diapherotrites archaeon]